MRKLRIIINPAAGQNTPILAQLNEVLGKEVDWDIVLTHKAGDAMRAATELVGNCDLIAVYGGDGTVMEVAQALYQKPTPMAIIPGGTANVMAKELGIPMDTIEALKLLKAEQPTIKQVDMGLINDQPFLIRINLGIIADIVHDTTREAKGSLGQLAYSASAVSNLTDQKSYQFELEINGSKQTLEGVALVVANSGNVGIPGISLMQDIDVSDGQLDVVLVRSSDITALLDIATTALFKTDYSREHMLHWEVQELKLRVAPQPVIIRDDRELKLPETGSSEIKIRIAPKAINILVPAADGVVQQAQ
jgi:diacylglycerol kinase (ATP)